MRRWAAGLLLVLGLGSAAASTVTTTALVVLRAEPATEALVTGVLQQGATVRIIKRYGNYVLVRSEAFNVEGYLLERMLRAAPGSRDAAPEPGSLAAPGDGPVAVTASADELPPVVRGPSSRPAAPLDPVEGVGQTWYVTADYGLALANISAAQLQAALAAAGGFSEVRRLDESSPSWQLGLGYRLTPHWALEVALLDLGTYGSQIDIRNADVDTARSVLAARHPVGGAGLRAGVAGGMSWRRFSFTAGLSLFRSSKTDIEVMLNGRRRTVEGRSRSAVLSAGLGYRLSRRWSGALSLSRLELNQSVLNASLRLAYDY